VGSELVKLRGQAPTGRLPATDPAAVRAAHQAVRDGVRSGAFHSAHDIAEGGLGLALAECCLAGQIGARVQLPDGIDLFAEAPGQAFVVSGSPEALEGHTVIGRVGGGELDISGQLSVAVSELAEAYEQGLEKFM
jgi:phosphoribosylformylglycinamidine synthase